MVIRTPTSPYYSPYVGGQHSYPRTPTTPGNFTTTRSRAGQLEAIPNIPILVTAFLAILATGGPTYSFGVYATTLKDTLHLSQSQLETLGAASFGAGFISWIPGLCVDAWGSQKALMVGGFCQCIGFLWYWIVSRFAYELLPEASIVPVLSFLSMLIFTSNNLVIGGVFKAIVVSCGLGTKGKAVGAAKAYLGLGAGVFSSLFGAIHMWTQSDLDFLAMSAICAILAIVLPALIALPSKSAVEQKGTKDESTMLHYNVVYAGLFILALVVVGSSAMFMFEPIMPADGDEDDAEETSYTSSASMIPEWIHGLLILLLWIGPVVSLLFLPTKSSKHKEFRRSQSTIRRKVRQAMERDHYGKGEKMRLLPPGGGVLGGAPKTTNANSSNGGTNDMEEQQQPPPKAIEDEDDEDDWAHACETPKPIPDKNLMEMLQTIPAWLFLLASTILVGSGTMLTINMGQMVQSRGLPPRAASACLAIFSVAQALARVAAGAVSESALQWKKCGPFFGISKGVPRTAFLVLSCALAVAGHGVLAVSAATNRTVFLLGITLTGFSFGALWPLMVLIVGDLFGTVNHGANYMFMDGFTCAVGTLSIAKFLTQIVYEDHIDSSLSSTTMEEDTMTVCYGEECFRSTHLIISGLCLLSLLACAALSYMTRSSYGSLLVAAR